MAITSISFSYLFLGIAMIAFSFYLYFRLILTETSPDNLSHITIFGEMKYKNHWREKNILMSYVSLFWTIISAMLFIYLKFFTSPFLMSIIYLVFYVALVAVSIVYGTVKNMKI